MFRKPKYTLILLLAVLMLGLHLRCIGITNPWGEHWDGWGGGYYSNIARNYIRYGYETTRFLPVLNGGEVKPEEFIFYTRHPPLLGLLLSFSYRLFGIKEWAGRLVPMVFSLLSILLLFFIGRRAGSARLGLLSAFFLSIMPRTVLYSTLLDPQGQLVIASTLTTLYGYLLYTGRTRPALSLAIMFFGFVLGALSDWGAFYIFGFLFLHYYFILKGRRIAILLLCFCCAAAFLLYNLYKHYALQGMRPENLGLFSAALVRIWGTGQTSMTQILSHCMEYGTIFLGVPFLLFLLGWMFVSVLPARLRREPMPGRLPILLLLGTGFFHVAIFPFGASVHEWWFVYLGPGVCMAGASLLDMGIRRCPPRLARAGGALVLAGMVGLAAYSSWTVSLHRAKWNTDIFRVLGEEIRKRTPARSLVLVTGNMPVALNFYTDREVYTLPPARLSTILSSLAEESRPGYLIIYTKVKEALRTEYKAYMEMMEAAGIETDVPWVDGYSVFLLKPKGREENRAKEAEQSH